MSLNEELLEAVRGRLRAKGVKLWIEPFWKDGACREDELLKLVNESFREPDFVAPQKGVTDVTLMECLQSLQNHALEKLRAKKSRTDTGSPAATTSFCAQVKIVDGSRNGIAGGKKTVCLDSLACDTKVADIIQRLKSELTGPGAPSIGIRLICKGRTLEHEAKAASLTKPGTTLPIIAIVSDATSQDGVSSSAIGEQGAAGAQTSVFSRSLAIKDAAKRISQEGLLGDLELTDQHGNYVPLSNDERVPLVTAISLHALGKKILRAVSDTPSSAGGGGGGGGGGAEAMDVAQDATVGGGGAADGGEGVKEDGAGGDTEMEGGGADAKMEGKSEAREESKERGAAESSPPPSSVAAAASAAAAAASEAAAAAAAAAEKEERAALLQRKYGEALAVFLQADEEWEHVGESWRSQVDNYGLLQLDICWAYLALAQLSSLPDAEARTRKAEAVLSKQVHSNFLTIAVLHAEEGKAVPPLAAPFVRLLLIKGVVKTLKGHKEEGSRLLSEGLVLCNALAVAEEHVESLLGLGASRAGAIVALRQHRGDVQQAGMSLLEGVEKKEAMRKEREKQRKLGSTLDGRGPVDLKQAALLKDLLLVSEKEAAWLLRLANNDVDRAVQVWQDVGRDSLVLKAELDSKFGAKARNGAGGTRNGGQQQAGGKGGKGAGGAGGGGGGPVDEVLLVSVMSLGVDRERAEAALRNAKGEGEEKIENAMQWLFGGEGVGEGAGDTAAAGGAGGGAQGAEGGTERMEEDARASSSSSSSSEDREEDGENEPEDALAREESRDRAYDLIEQELGDAFRSKDLDEEHIGLPLVEEKALLEQYLGLGGGGWGGWEGTAALRPASA